MQLGHHFWDQWCRMCPRQHRSAASLDTVIYLWIKIQKEISLLNKHLPSSGTRCSSFKSEIWRRCRWKAASDGMAAAFCLPPGQSMKPLLWKHGGRPVQHRTLVAAQTALKLHHLSFSLDPFGTPLFSHPEILKELNLLSTEISDDSEGGGLLNNLATDVSLRK